MHLLRNVEHIYACKSFIVIELFPNVEYFRRRDF